MYVKPDQLAATLKKGLAPVYLLTGDEPLQLGEAADEVRRAARRAGFDEREVLQMQESANWRLLAEAAEAMSIFAEKKLIDLRLPSAKPGMEGAKALRDFCARKPEHALLLMTAGKLEGGAKKAQWVQAFDAAGVVVQVWPLQAGETAAWVRRRAERRGLRLEAAAADLLAARVEGNLLAAAQEIEKLYVLYGETTVSRQLLAEAVADQARFDVFKLTDAVLAGDAARAARVLHGLRAENLPPPVVLWALSREARALLQGKSGGGFGGDRHLAADAARRRLKTAGLYSILRACAAADLQAKGQAPGDVWESLFGICMDFAHSGAGRSG